MKLIILSPNLDLIFSEQQKSALEENFEVVYYIKPSSLETIPELISDEEKIFAIDPDFCGWKITREDLEKMKNIKAICLQTTAYHYIDAEYLKLKNIPVTNLRGFSTNAVAEQSFAMIFALARKLPMVLREGCIVNFDRYRGIELE
jgi:lactate dehydrogenase-like 2-hydroxyacid dehydrogenase